MFSPLFPLFPPRRRPLIFADASAAVPPLFAGRSNKSNLVRFFRNPPPRPPRRDDGPPPPPDDNDNNEIFNPLSAREERAYLILAGIGCLPFLLLLLLAIITHSPFVAQ